MKVLKEGARHKPKWPGCWECPHCGSEIELEEGDEVTEYDSQRGGYMIAFECPVCGQCRRKQTSVRRHRSSEYDGPCTYVSTRCSR